MIHKYKTSTQFFVAIIVCTSLQNETKERNKGRTANKILLEFHKQPTDFNEMFIQFYVTYIKHGNILC